MRYTPFLKYNILFCVCLLFYCVFGLFRHIHTHTHTQTNIQIRLAKQIELLSIHIFTLTEQYKMKRKHFVLSNKNKIVKIQTHCKKKTHTSKMSCSALKTNYHLLFCLSFVFFAAQLIVCVCVCLFVCLFVCFFQGVCIFTILFLLLRTKSFLFILYCSVSVNM